MLHLFHFSSTWYSICKLELSHAPSTLNNKNCCLSWKRYLLPWDPLAARAKSILSSIPCEPAFSPTLLSLPSYTVASSQAYWNIQGLSPQTRKKSLLYTKHLQALYVAFSLGGVGGGGGKAGEKQVKRTSLVIQWVRICLPRQGTQDAHAFQLLSPCFATREATSTPQEKPVHCNEEWPLPVITRESLCAAMRPSATKNKY